jgi:flagellar biosynthesis protein FliQ
MLAMAVTLVLVMPWMVERFVEMFRTAASP